MPAIMKWEVFKKVPYGTGDYGGSSKMLYSGPNEGVNKVLDGLRYAPEPAVFEVYEVGPEEAYKKVFANNPSEVF